MFSYRELFVHGMPNICPMIRLTKKYVQNKRLSQNKMLNVQYPEIPRWCVELAWLVGFSSPKSHKTRHPKCPKCTGAGWGIPPLVRLRKSIFPDRGVGPVPGPSRLLLAEIYRSVRPQGVIVGGLPNMTDLWAETQLIV